MTTGSIKKMGTVVLGGGTGFIGNAVAKHLKSIGYQVTIVSRKPGNNCMTWNELQTKGFPDRTVAVINLAGQNILDPTRRWTPGFKQNVWASRVNTTKYLVKAIIEAQQKPKVFVTTSGVGFYPPSVTAEYDETGEGGDFDFLSRLCFDWESAAQLPSEINVRTVTIRSGVVLGRTGGMIKQLFAPFYLGFGGPVGSGSQYLPWIHIDDISSLFVYALNNDNMKGIVNGVAPQYVTNGEFAKAFGNALWRPSFVPLPTFALNLMFSSERAKIMTEGQKVIPRKALDCGFTYKFPDIKSATEEFSHLFYSEVK